jgi:hypothetical protein
MTRNLSSLSSQFCTQTVRNTREGFKFSSFKQNSLSAGPDGPSSHTQESSQNPQERPDLIPRNPSLPDIQDPLNYKRSSLRNSLKNPEQAFSTFTYTNFSGLGEWGSRRGSFVDKP